MPAFLAALGSLATCYGSMIAALLLGVEVKQVVSPHLQAILMWGLALLAVFALWRDRRRHGGRTPPLVGVLALVVLIWNPLSQL